MKNSKWIVASLCGMLMATSLNPVNALANPPESVIEAVQEREAIRNQLVATYNQLISLSDDKWTQQLLKGAKWMRNKGHDENARVLEVLSQPQFRETTLTMLKEQIDSNSENGILALVFASANLFWEHCTRNWHLDVDDNILCAGMVILSILSLNGDEMIAY